MEQRIEDLFKDQIKVITKLKEINQKHMILAFQFVLEQRIRLPEENDHCTGWSMD